MDILKIPILRRIYPSIVRRLFILIGKIKFIYNIKNFRFEIDIRESIERKTYFQGDYERKRTDAIPIRTRRCSSSTKRARAESGWAATVATVTSCKEKPAKDRQIQRPGPV